MNGCEYGVGVNVYGVRVVAYFVELEDMAQELSGFFATFSVRSDSFAGAKAKLSEVVADRMRRHGVSLSSAFPFISFFVIDSMWEISEDAITGGEFEDKGFTFFDMNFMDHIRAAAKRGVLKSFRPESLIALDEYF